MVENIREVNRLYRVLSFHFYRVSNGNKNLKGGNIEGCDDQELTIFIFIYD